MFQNHDSVPYDKKIPTDAKPMTQKKEKPGCYGVIPASVLYDKKIPAGAKLLYVEISALCGTFNNEYHCWATNSYFTELYGASESSIKNWIRVLRDEGYISVFYKNRRRLLKITKGGSH